MTTAADSTRTLPPILIYGAGGFAREVAWLASEAVIPRQIAAFIDDSPERSGGTLAGVPVLTLDQAAQRHPGLEFIVAVGSGSLREQLAERAVARGLRATTLVHKRVEMSQSVRIGPGTVICAGAILTVDITLGPYTQINLDCTIGHDAVLGEYSTLAPGVHVSGFVHIEKGAYLGTGAAVINGTAAQPLVIGANAVIGAGAVVTRSILAGTTAVGVPARTKG